MKNLPVSPGRAGLLLLLTGQMLPMIDTSITNVALDSITQSLGTTPTQLELIVALYGVAFAVSVAVYPPARPPLPGVILGFDVVRYAAGQAAGGQGFHGGYVKTWPAIFGCYPARPAAGQMSMLASHTPRIVVSVPV